MSQVVALFSLERRRICRLKPAPALSFFYSDSLSFDSVPLKKKLKEEKKLTKELAGKKIKSQGWHGDETRQT